jgi:hypothetical protein
MDCREFRNKHVAFVDDLLPGWEMEAMERHLMVCCRCSRQDTAVRRSLLIVRNLPPIEPSRDFIQRLNARLDELGPVPRVDVVAPRGYLPSASTFAALAAGIAAVAYMVVETTHYFVPPDQLGTASIVATTAPVMSPFEPSPGPMASAAFVVSVPTGMPVWPAVLMVGEAPTRFASLDFKDGDPNR